MLILMPLVSACERPPPAAAVAPEVLEARRLKSELAEELAPGTSSFISANLYRTMADYPHRRAID